MTDWRWVSQRIAEAVHSRQLAEHGGGDGTRDQGLLDSVLARPQNLDAYGQPDAAALAAAYAYGIARNHPFIDGNKRTAWVVARLFLAMNERELEFEQLDAIQTMLDLAAGEITEDELADWFRERIGA